MRNYDLNIWDELAYETSDRLQGGWKINVFDIPFEGAQYGSGTMLEQYLWLRPHEASMMDLQNEDSDFWIDIESLLDDKLVPRRVRKWLESLPQE